MSPLLALDPVEALDHPEALDEAELELDMRVVEAATSLAVMMCDTGDGCGSTCSTSACSTNSNDPS